MDNIVREEDAAKMQRLVDEAMEEAVRGVGGPEEGGEQ